MNPSCEGGPGPQAPRAQADESGFVLVWMALTMLILLAAVGLAVDVANWSRQGNKLQTVADGAAMAGAVFLPDDFEQAQLAAMDVIRASGLEGVLVPSIGPGSTSNQLRVSVEREVDNVFASLVGFDTIRIRRDATAEFSAPVEMGSPEFILGNDPESDGAQPDYFLGLAGPEANKQMGDRFASRFCQGAVECSSGANDTYEPEGYTFVVRTTASTPPGPLHIQLFDPAFVEGGTVCQLGTFPSAERLEELRTRSGTVPGLPAGWYDDAPTRYAGGKTRFCTGDNDVNGASVETSVVIKAPDATPWDDSDNPILSQPNCAPTTFPAWSPSKMGTTIDQLLDPAVGDPAEEWVVDPTDGRWTLAEVWRRWVTVCEIPASQVVQGDYLVTVRSSARASDPTRVDETVATAGQNFYSLRAGAATETGVDGTGVQTFARGRLPIYANKDGAETTIYTVKLQPGGTGRVLTIGFYDAGDASVPGTLQVLPPEDSNVGPVFRGCAFRQADGTALPSAGDDSCTVVDVSRATGFNGQLMYADVPIPDDYTCDRGSTTGCWVRVRLSFPGGVEDFTTWSAGVSGAPVRLVE